LNAVLKQYQKIKATAKKPLESGGWKEFKKKYTDAKAIAVKEGWSWKWEDKNKIYNEIK